MPCPFRKWAEGFSAPRRLPGHLGMPRTESQPHYPLKRGVKNFPNPNGRSAGQPQDPEKTVVKNLPKQKPFVTFLCSGAFPWCLPRIPHPRTALPPLKAICRMMRFSTALS